MDWNTLRSNLVTLATETDAAVKNFTNETLGVPAAQDLAFLDGFKSALTAICVFDNVVIAPVSNNQVPNIVADLAMLQGGIDITVADEYWDQNANPFAQTPLITEANDVNKILPAIVRVQLWFAMSQGERVLSLQLNDIKIILQAK